MGPLGWQETVFIFVLALLIFGPKKLPELGRNVAKAIAEFRRASSDLKAQFDREMSAIERENESLKEVTQSIADDINSSYDSSYYDYDAYGSDSYHTPADDTPSVGASATQGAEQTANASSQTKQAPEGTVAQGDPVASPGTGTATVAQNAPASANGSKAPESSPLAT